jgi:hypothetical protein
MGRACSTHGDNMNAYRIFVGKPERNTGVGWWIILKWIFKR